jgi:hypothetical protein
MSRSRKTIPVCGITSARTEKQDKREANRKIRRVVRQRLRVAPDGEVLPHVRELSNAWSMSKDGKQFFDPARNPELLRK